MSHLPPSSAVRLSAPAIVSLVPASATPAKVPEVSGSLALVPAPAESTRAPSSSSGASPVNVALSVEEVVAQVQLLQRVMAVTMREGEHWAKVPGCGERPTLLKAGAEKICLTFRLAPRYEIQERDLGGDHREYRVVTTLSSILTGAFVGQGVGLCSTREARYRYRGGAGRKCPECGARAIIKGKAEYGGGWVCYRKKQGCGTKFAEGDRAIEGQEEGRGENPDLADCFNTVLKMSKKRSLVDAVLTASAASDLFTQDAEDLAANLKASGGAGCREGEASSTAVEGAPERRRDPQDPGASVPVRDREEVSLEVTPAPALATDWRMIRVHFGKNAGVSLAELSDEQVTWYLERWLPRREAAGPLAGEDAALAVGLRAYERWRVRASAPQALSVDA